MTLTGRKNSSPLKNKTGNTAKARKYAEYPVQGAGKRKNIKVVK